MDYIFDDWKKILSDFQNSVEKDLAEIHKQKTAVQQMKTEIFDRLDSGQYIYDASRIVLSAPEIIIGHVDKSGDLKGSGKVIIRGTEVDVEGVGESGTISSRAPVIQQTAVDPGIDGQEAVVYPHSAVLTQARSVVLQSNEAKDAFSRSIAVPSGSGITIHADQLLNIDASISSEARKADIEASVTALKQQKSDLKSATDKQKSSIEKLFKDLQKLMDDSETNNDGFLNTRMNLVDISKTNDEVQSILPVLYRVTVDFIHSVSQQAELSRQITALEAEKKDIKSGDDFKKKSTGALLSLNSESISMTTVDADGNLRMNDGAGVSIWTPHMGISMNQADGTLVEKGAFCVSSENVMISTANPKADGSEITAAGQVNISSKAINLEAMDYQSKDKAYTEKGLAADGKVSITAKTIEVATTNPKDITRDDKGKVTKGEYTAEGDVIIRSKTVAVETLDYEVADGKLKPKTLTKDSKIEMRSEKMGMLAADTEGKATGSISLNAKAVAVKSMDVDKEKLTDSKLAAGSTMTLVSEKMYVGSKSKDIKSKKIQAVSEEIGAFADNTLEIQQGDGKAVVQLDGGNASMGGSKTQIYGETTINAKTEVKGELDAPKIVGDSIQAKSAFNSPNISDGMGGGAGGGGGSLSAKLKTEDAPKEQ
jgi:hypothetical protein